MNLSKSTFTLVAKKNLEYYQRDIDSFICLSDLCQDIKQPIGNFFKQLEVKLTLARIYPNRKTPSSFSVKQLVQTYPELIEQNLKSSRMNSGVWVTPELTECIEHWIVKLKESHWYNFISPDVKTKDINQSQQSQYYFRCDYYALHEPSGYIDVSCINLSLKKLMQNVRFILALETVSQNLNIQTKLLNTDGHSSIFDTYRKLFWVVEAGKQTKIYVHPDVMQIFMSDNALRLKDVIRDWQRRTENAPYLHYITTLRPETFGLGQLCPSVGRTSLHDLAGSFLLQVTDLSYQWQLILQLDNKFNQQYWFIHPEMLENDVLQGWTPENYTSDRQLTYLRFQRGSHPFDDFLEKLDKIRILGIKKRDRKLNELQYQYEYGTSEEIKTIELGEEITETIEHLIEATSRLIDSKNVKQSLESLGYQRPQQKIVPNKKPHCPSNNQLSTQADKFKVIMLGDVKVRQRIKDGFICANDMCRPFSADLYDWLKTERTWDDFASVAKELKLKFNSDLNRSSITTRVVEAFPTLIERKKGNSFNGGGTWIQHHMAVKMAYWLDAGFATKMTFYVEEYSALKTILKLKHQDDYSKIESELESFLNRKLAN